VASFFIAGKHPAKRVVAQVVVVKECRRGRQTEQNKAYAGAMFEFLSVLSHIHECVVAQPDCHEVWMIKRP
jgi:hypothetical protein